MRNGDVFAEVSKNELDPISSGQRTGRREESTGYTQKLEESSFDTSPNNSEIMFLREINELKQLCNLQGLELENAADMFTSANPGADRMKEIFQSINREPSLSYMNSIYNQGSIINFNDNSRQILSPVPNDYEGSIFASSLMSMSNYQLEDIIEKDRSSVFLNFVVKKHKLLEIKKRLFFVSYIQGLRL